MFFPWLDVLAQVNAAGTGVSLAPYQTQTGTAELPPRYRAPTGAHALDRLAYWSETAWRANALDHTPPMPGQRPREVDQVGPHRSSRALAIVHIAVYDALNAIYRRYPAYSAGLMAFADSSPDAAIAQAAHDTLVSLYPQQKAWLDARLEEDLARLCACREKLRGIEIGRRAAAAILALRANDGSHYQEAVVGRDYFPELEAGQWWPDPVSQIRLALGAHWHRLTPFVLVNPAALRPAAPPSLLSEAYTAAFNEVRQLGGDGSNTPSSRTPGQTAAGIFWSYDGTAWLGAPPRLYNQIAMHLARGRSSDALQLARVMAMVNVAMADAAMVVWEAKYHYDFWRPVTAIRAASPGNAYLQHGDGNRATVGDPGWTPLGAQASNLIGPDFTPPFPSYPSGHAGLGTAMFHVLRRLYGNGVAFTFVPDELNGITRDNSGAIRPYLPRSFSSLSQAIEENGRSRIYLGLHWRFDQAAGTAVGIAVADAVVAGGLVPPSR